MQLERSARVAGWTLLATALAGAALVLLVRGQVSRHRRDLFSHSSLERLAALGYLSQEPATVDALLLLRDFLAWEASPLLRRRATTLLGRMEHDLREARDARDARTPQSLPEAV